MATVEITRDNFEAQVLQAEKPILLDFWAGWCAPCKQLSPILEELSEEFAQHLTIGKIDTDAQPELGQAFRIQSLPTLIFMQGGQPKDAIQGALPKKNLIAKIKSWIPALVGPEIAAEELSTELTTNPSLIVFDIREETHFVRSHILGSQCVAVEEIESRLAEGGGLASAVLVCRTGDKSLELAKQLSQKGFPVRALVKGLLNWEGDGFATYSTKEEKRLQQST